MNKKIGLVTLIAATTFASLASAQDSGVEVGARLGYGIPLGKVHSMGDGDNALSDSISGQIPLQLDLGYRLDPQLLLGGYFQYGIAFPSDDACDPDGVSCSASNVRLGLQAQYHFDPITVDGAWIGGGIGYEWMTVHVEAGGIDGSVQVRGFEFLNLQGGYDFVVADKLRVGPYALLSIGQYSGSTVETAGISQSNSIDEKAIHSWLMLGVKGSYGAL